MNINLYSLIFILLVVSIIGCSKNSTPKNKEPKELSLAFNEELVIGNNVNAPQEQLLAMPVQIQTDSAGKIYIADIRLHAIQIYDKKGNYIQTIGQKGDGPGEFGSYPIFDINENNQLVVLDIGNQRISYFSSDGELISTHIPSRNEMIWPGRFRETGDGDIIMLHKPRYTGDDDKDSYTSYLIHHFSPLFEDRLSSFAHIKSITDTPSQFVNFYMNSINAGSFYLTNDTTFWYAPGIYGGRLYRFRKDNRRWIHADTINGKLYPRHSVNVDTDTDDALEIMVFTEEGQETANGLVNSDSRGLFQLNDGRMIHFSSQKIADSTQTIVEIFSNNGEIIGSGRLSAFTFPSGPFGSDGYALWKDSKDRFYFVNNQNEPLVRVGEIEGL